MMQNESDSIVPQSALHVVFEDYALREHLGIFVTHLLPGAQIVDGELNTLDLLPFLNAGHTFVVLRSPTESFVHLLNTRTTSAEAALTAWIAPRAALMSLWRKHRHSITLVNEDVFAEMPAHVIDFLESRLERTLARHVEPRPAPRAPSDGLGHLAADAILSTNGDASAVIAEMRTASVGLGDSAAAETSTVLTKRLLSHKIAEILNKKDLDAGAFRDLYMADLNLSTSEKAPELLSDLLLSEIWGLLKILVSTSSELKQVQSEQLTYQEASHAQGSQSSEQIALQTEISTLLNERRVLREQLGDTQAACAEMAEQLADYRVRSADLVIYEAMNTVLVDRVAEAEERGRHRAGIIASLALGDARRLQALQSRITTTDERADLANDEAMNTALAKRVAEAEERERHRTGIIASLALDDARRLHALQTRIVRLEADLSGVSQQNIEQAKRIETLQSETQAYAQTISVSETHVASLTIELEGARAEIDKLKMELSEIVGSNHGE